MSEYLHAPKENTLLLAVFTQKLIKGKTSKTEVNEILKKLSEAGPGIFISAVDHVVKQAPVTPEMKKGINKMLNVFYSHLNSLPTPEIVSRSFLAQLVKDNTEIRKYLNALKPEIKVVQIPNTIDDAIRSDLITKLEVLQKVDSHYQVLENILFPYLEKQWPDHRCFQVLWSVHDDVRMEISELKKLLIPGNWDLIRFNRLTGDLFFNVNTIIFREEKIILPAIMESGLSKMLDSHLGEASEIGWSFIESTEQKESNEKKDPVHSFNDSIMNFATGKLKPEQVDLIFNHLPVDITYVDEHDTVQYFSSPPGRTFTRTPAVIGRKVQNCHPPESVHIVEEIVEAFRKGEKDEASFWIPFKEQFVLIKYYAVRDKKGVYRGTIEVTQDISEIKNLDGERRLLNWSTEE